MSRAAISRCPRVWGQQRAWTGAKGEPALRESWELSREGLVHVPARVAVTLPPQSRDSASPAGMWVRGPAAAAEAGSAAGVP